MPSSPKPYIPFPVPRDRILLAYAYRSTMLRSTVAILEQRGLYDAYVAALAPANRDAILVTVPGEWLPAEVAMAHYEACDRLGLSEMEQASIGWETSRRFHGPVLMTALRAMGAVSSPWAATSLVHRTWGRVWRGSAIAVSKLAQNETILELAGWPPARAGDRRAGPVHRRDDRSSHRLVLSAPLSAPPRPASLPPRAPCPRPMRAAAWARRRHPAASTAPTRAAGASS